MSLKQRRLMLIIGLAVIIAGASFYSSAQIGQNRETPSGTKVATAGIGTEMAVVYISGGVNKPGVVKVPATSRVLDVVNAAGGLAVGADAGKINLAQRVADGMHVQVPIVVTPGSVVNGAMASDKISINRASVQELDKLPGIGPALAQRIVDYRQANGEFKAITDLKNVSGIGENKFKQLQDKISL